MSCQPRATYRGSALRVARLAATLGRRGSARRAAASAETRHTAEAGCIAADGIRIAAKISP